MTVLTEARQSRLRCNEESIFFSLSPSEGIKNEQQRALSKQFIQEKSRLSLLLPRANLSLQNT